MMVVPVLVHASGVSIPPLCVKRNNESVVFSPDVVFSHIIPQAGLGTRGAGVLGVPATVPHLGATPVEARVGAR